jgi:type III secretion protein C
VRPQSSTEVAGDARVRTPSIQSDSRLNALIIQDLPERMPLYERLIAQLDVPTPLIEIEAMIIDINSERVKELGINWAVRANGVSIGLGPTSSQPGSGTFGLNYNGSSSTLSESAGVQLLAQIRVLETRGEARIQSRPSILTLENIGALLDLSETFYVRVLGERFASVSPVTAGTSLRVTPRLIEQAEAAIQMTIDIEDGQIQDRQIDSLPTVRRSTVSTQAIVRQSEALLIAGYSSDQNIDNAQKVPLLGDLPVVGALFSTRSKAVQKRERLFIIRPKVVALGSTPVASAGNDVSRVPGWALETPTRRGDAQAR